MKTSLLYLGIDLGTMNLSVAFPPSPANLKLLPETMLNPLCRHLQLSQHLRPAQEIEVPSVRLSQYHVPASLPIP